MASFVINVLLSLLTIIIGTPILMLVAKVLKFQNNNFITALKINIISGLAVFIFSFISFYISSLLSILIMIILIKKFYNSEGWGKSILAWFVWAIITGPIIVILVLITTFVGLLKLASLLGK